VQTVNNFFLSLLTPTIATKTITTTTTTCCAVINRRTTTAVYLSNNKRQKLHDDRTISVRNDYENLLATTTPTTKFQDFSIYIQFLFFLHLLSILKHCYAIYYICFLFFSCIKRTVSLSWIKRTVSHRHRSSSKQFICVP
jgi:hypothetical protein